VNKTFYSHTYAVAGATMRSGFRVGDSETANRTESVYVTRYGLFSSRTTKEEEDTPSSHLARMIAVVLLLVATCLYVIGFAVQLIEWPTRRLLGSRHPELGPAYEPEIELVELPEGAEHRPRHAGPDDQVEQLSR
jgi:hypothetical protein